MHQFWADECVCLCVLPSIRQSPQRTGSGREVRKHHFRRARGPASAQLVTVLGGPRPSDRRAPQLQNGKKRPLKNSLTPPSFRANGNGPREVVVRGPHNETERFPGGGLRAPLDTKRKGMASGRWSRLPPAHRLATVQLFGPSVWCVVVWCGVQCRAVGVRCCRRPPAQRLASAQVLFAFGGHRPADWLSGPSGLKAS